MKPNQIDAHLLAIGRQAVVQAPELKVFTIHNSADHFSLVATPTAYSAMMDEVIAQLDSKDKAKQRAMSDWFNEAAATKRGAKHSRFDAMAKQAAIEAYAEIVAA